MRSRLNLGIFEINEIQIPARVNLGGLPGSRQPGN